MQERIVALEVLSVTTHINCIVVRCLINVRAYVPLSGHDDVALFE